MADGVEYKVCDDCRDKIHAIVERLWNDVNGLPWSDPQWLNNAGAREQTKQHYVNATVDDIVKLLEEKPDAES